MRRKAFTLIELLIVVAIIAILAAIAVPNFLEAQTRAKVSRVKSDMRALGVAHECYVTDYGKYPYAWQTLRGHWFLAVEFTNGRSEVWGNLLTSPIAYITSIPYDPFTTRAFNDPLKYTKMWPGVPINTSVLYFYSGRSILNWPWYGPPYYPVMHHDIAYAMHSCGPDNALDWPPKIYDPTNGTVSPGQIFYIGKGVGFPPLQRTTVLRHSETQIW